MRGTASTLPVVGEKRGRRHGRRNCHRHLPDDVEDADSIALETSAASVAENGMAQSRRRRRDSAPGIDGDRHGQSNDLLRDGSRRVAESLEAIARPLFLSLVVVQSALFSHHLAVTAASAATGGDGSSTVALVDRNWYFLTCAALPTLTLGWRAFSMDRHRHLRSGRHDRPRGDGRASSWRCRRGCSDWRRTWTAYVVSALLQQFALVVARLNAPAAATSAANGDHGIGGPARAPTIFVCTAAGSVPVLFVLCSCSWAACIVVADRQGLLLPCVRETSSPRCWRNPRVWRRRRCRLAPTATRTRWRDLRRSGARPCRAGRSGRPTGEREAPPRIPRPARGKIPSAWGRRTRASGNCGAASPTRSSVAISPAAPVREASSRPSRSPRARISRKRTPLGWATPASHRGTVWSPRAFRSPRTRCWTPCSATPPRPSLPWRLLFFFTGSSCPLSTARDWPAPSMRVSPFCSFSKPRLRRRRRLSPRGSPRRFF